jgi:hypothetical protein
MATLTLVCMLLLAVVNKLLADEAKDWLPFLAKRIKATAVKRLPPEVRERYSEEWETDLSEIPGSIGKLIYSIGFISAASGIGRAFQNANGIPKTPPWMRGIDILASFLALSLVAPWLIIVCALIRFESPGPVFIRILRVRDDGKCFWAWSLRTMTFRSLKVTRTGRILRKYQLQEIPRLFNILRGELTFFPPNDRSN